MKSPLFILAALPLALTIGCVESHRTVAYSTPPPGTYVGPTSASPAVRVYPDSPNPRIATSPGETDDLTIANSVRSILARDTAHIYGNVDVAVNSGLVTLRGTVPTEHDRQQLHNEIANVPGVGSVDNQLGVNNLR